MSVFICHNCNQSFKLSEGDIVYDGNFFHKQCDPNPNSQCLGTQKTKFESSTG